MLFALEGKIGDETCPLAQRVKNLTQAVLGSQPNKRFIGRFPQVNRCPASKAMIGGNNEAEPFFSQHNRFQATVGGWHWRDDDHIQGTSPQLVEHRRRTSLLEGERNIGMCGEKCIEQSRYVTGPAAMDETERDTASLRVDNFLEIFSGSA